MSDTAQREIDQINDLIRSGIQAKDSGSLFEAVDYYEVALQTALQLIMRILSEKTVLGEGSQLVPGGLLDRVFNTQTRARPIGVFGLPRSGTTFVTTALMELAGLPLSDVCIQPPGLGQGEQWLRSNDLDAARLLDACSGERTFVMHTHPMPSAANLALIQQHGIRVIFTTRPLPDSLLSISEMLDKQLHTSAAAMQAAGGAQWAVLRLSPAAVRGYMGMTTEEKLDFLIDYAAPWCIQYLAGWEEALPRLASVIHVAYADIVEDEAGTLVRIFRHLGLDVSKDEIVAHVEGIHRRKPFYLAHGIIGRGSATMSEHQRKRLRSMAICYGGDDFAARYCP